MLEIVPQHTYRDENGIPAWKSGEWYGSRPNHFVGSKLILRQIRKPENDKYFGHSVHFPPKFSEEYKFRPSVKKVGPFKHDENIRQGKKYIEPKYTEPRLLERKISYRPKEDMLSSYIPPLFPRRRKFDIPKISKEYTVEKLMAEKRRIYSLDQQRNSISDYNPGDKIYRGVEYSPGFYKLEGLIVGSTNRLNLHKNHSKKDDNYFDTLDLNIKLLNTDKKWKNKQIKESLNLDRNYVSELNNWEENNFEKEQNSSDEENGNN